MTRPTEEQIKAVKIAFAEYLLSRKPRNDGTIRVEMDNLYANSKAALKMRDAMRNVLNGPIPLIPERPSAWARTMATCEINRGFPVMVGNTMWRIVRAGRRNWKIEKIADVPEYKPRIAPAIIPAGSTWQKIGAVVDDAYEEAEVPRPTQSGIVTEEMMKSVIDAGKQTPKRPSINPVVDALVRKIEATPWGKKERDGSTTESTGEIPTVTIDVALITETERVATANVFAAIQRVAESYGYVKPEGEGDTYKIYAWEAAAKHVEYLTGVIKNLSRTYSPVVLRKVSSTLLHAITGSEYDAIDTATKGLRKLAESYGYTNLENEGSIREVSPMEEIPRHVEYLTGVLKKLSSAETLEYKPEPVQMMVGDEFEPAVGPDFNPFVAVVKCVQAVANRYGYSAAARGEWSKSKGRAWQVAIDQMRYLNGMLGTLQETAIEHAISEKPQARYDLFTELTALAESYGYNIPWENIPASRELTVWENARFEVKHLSEMLDKFSRFAAAQVEAFSAALACEVPNDLE